jgi:hypothetical protein
LVHKTKFFLLISDSGVSDPRWTFYNCEVPLEINTIQVRCHVAV